MLNERIGPETASDFRQITVSNCVFRDSRIHGRLTSTIRCSMRLGLTRSICPSRFRRNASVQ